MNKVRELSVEKINQILGTDENSWRSEYCRYAPKLTFYNTGTNVFCFNHGFADKRDCSCRVLVPDEEIPHSQDYKTPSFLFFGYALGRAIIHVRGIRRQYSSLKPGICLHVVRSYSDEVDDYDHYLSRKHLIKDAEFKSIFGKKEFAEFTRLYRDIGERVLDLLTYTQH